MLFIKKNCSVLTHIISMLCGCTFIIASNNSWSAGFINYIQSAKSAGTGGSLATVGEYDASAIFYNPASLPKASKRSFLFSTPIGKPSIKFENMGTLNIIGSPVIGNNVVKEDFFVTPNIAVVSKFNDKMTVGIGVYIPFGQIREYDENWVGRYHAVSSELTTLNINPSIRYDLNESFSIGAAFQIEYIDHTLKSAIDFKSVCLINFGSGCPLPTRADGMQTLYGDDWGTGYSLGILFKPKDGFNIGIAYRSSIKHDISGMANYDVPMFASPLTMSGAFTDTKISIDMIMPDVFSIGTSYSINSKMTIYADAALTRWSRFKESVVHFANPIQPTLTLKHDWNDAWRFAIGGDYKLSSTSYVSLGIAHDQSPIPSTTIDAILPDSDSLMLAIGYGLYISDSLSIDLAYVRFQFDSVSVQNNTLETGMLNGKYRVDNDAVGVQLNWLF